MGRHTVVLELYLAESAVCKEDVVERILFESSRVQLDCIAKMVLLELRIGLPLELLGLGQL